MGLRDNVKARYLMLSTYKNFTARIDRLNII